MKKTLILLCSLPLLLPILISSPLLVFHFTRYLLVAFLPLIISLLPLLALPTSPHRPVSIFAFILVACTARPGRKKRHSQKKDGAVAAWSNVSWVIESQLHQLGQSPSRTIARRHFNAYHTATFASSCARAPAVVNWSLTQNALKWWSCLVLPYVIIVFIR